MTKGGTASQLKILADGINAQFAKSDGSRETKCIFRNKGKKKMVVCVEKKEGLVHLSTLLFFTPRMKSEENVERSPSLRSDGVRGSDRAAAHQFCLQDSSR